MVRAKNNLRAIRGPGRLEDCKIQHLSLVATVSVHYIGAIVALAAGEDNLSAVWRPGGEIISRGSVRQALKIGAVDIDDINLEIAITPGDKGDPRPIWRPFRPEITVWMIDKLS